MSLHFAVYQAERDGPREVMRPDLRLSNNSQRTLSIASLDRGLRRSKRDLTGAFGTGDERKQAFSWGWPAEISAPLRLKLLHLNAT